jgi:hypothetical protein
MSDEERELRAFAEAVAQTPGAKGRAARRVLEEGIFYPRPPRPRPPGVRRRAEQACYRNAFLVVTDHPSWRYCEGFALAQGLPFPIPHAWCVDERGTVVEVTWKDAGAGYLGVPLEPRAVAEIVAASRRFGPVLAR